MRVTGGMVRCSQSQQKISTALVRFHARVRIPQLVGQTRVQEQRMNPDNDYATDD